MLDVPGASSRRVAVRATNDAVRHARHGHPWLWEQSITSVSHDANVGDLAVVFDADRRFVAIGLYDPSSPIRVRLLHHGTPTTIDGSFWSARLDAAFERRAGLFADPDTTAFRLVHGENDALPGLVIDRYDTTVVVKLDTAAWFPHLGAVLVALLERFPATSVVLRMSRTVTAPAGLNDGDVLVGLPISAPVPFRENGLWFEADVTAGQKTGHFLDQRDNRQRVRQIASGADVLDVFSCTGGFSVYAAAGGARSAHAVDISTQALASARRNIERNSDRGRRSDFRFRSTAGDAFEVLAHCSRLGERYDIVIVDPPSFARRQDDVRQALRAYRRLTSLAAPLVRPGGLLVQSSCSARIDPADFDDAVLGTLADGGHRVGQIERTAHAVDHPVAFAQGAYLKSLFIRLT